MTIALHLKNKVLTFLFILNTSQWLFLPDNDGAGVEAGHLRWKRRQASRGIQTSVPLPGEDVDRLPACFSSVLSHLSFFLSSSFTLFYIKRDLFSLLISPHYIKNCFFFFPAFPISLCSLTRRVLNLGRKIFLWDHFCILGRCIVRFNTTLTNLEIEK